MVVLFLGCILLGVLVAGILHGALSFKKFFRNLKVIRHYKHKDSTNYRIGMLFEEAENFIACGNVSKAISVYEKILDFSPNHVSVLIRLGNTLREQGNSARALELHLKAAQVAPKNLDVLYGLADDYLAKAMCRLEMEALKKISKIDRISPRVFYRMREAYLKSENWALAEDIQKKLISRVKAKEKKEKEKKILGRYIYNNGVRYFNNGNFESAISEFKRALRENNQCLSAYVMLGEAFLKASNIKGALKVWKKGYENTSSLICLIRMEKVYRKLDQVGEMIREYKDALKKSQNSTRETLSLLLGSLYLEEGHSQETIRVIKENINSKKAIIPSLILADAYKQECADAQSQQALKNASHQVKGAILNFKCGVCGKNLDEWADSCSQCKAFDGIECCSGINS